MIWPVEKAVRAAVKQKTRSGSYLHFEPDGVVKPGKLYPNVDMMLISRSHGEMQQMPEPSVLLHCLDVILR